MKKLNNRGGGRPSHKKVTTAFAALVCILAISVTSVSADVTDNTNGSIITAINGLGTKIVDALSPMQSLEKIDNLTRAVNKLALSSSMDSFDKLAFETASWGTVHDILQTSSLEYCTWKVGDKKTMGNNEVVITKITYNADGIPDEINLGMQKAVTRTGTMTDIENWCKNEACKQADTLTGVIGLGKTGHLPAYGEIPESLGADIHITTLIVAVTSKSTGGILIEEECMNKLSNNDYGYYLYKRERAIGNAQWVYEYYSQTMPVVPVITIH